MRRSVRGPIMRRLEVEYLYMSKAAKAKPEMMSRRLMMSGIRKEGQLYDERTVLMIQKEHPLRIPKSVQTWIRKNVPTIPIGKMLRFTKPTNPSTVYVSDWWKVVLHLRSMARNIAYAPSEYPKSVRRFFGSLPKNQNAYMVVVTGHVGTEAENWRGFAPKRG
jgi:hypothetical protein